MDICEGMTGECVDGRLEIINLIISDISLEISSDLFFS